MLKAIVIGAGISGISTARALQTEGCEVLVLEGRERIGGRLFTASLGGQPVDLGAQWLQSSVGNPITALCAEHGIQHSYAPNDLKPYGANGQRVSQKRLRALEQIQDQILEECAEQGHTLIEANRADISLATAIENSETWRKLSTGDLAAVTWMLNASINSDLAQDSHLISLFRFLTDSQREPYRGAERLFQQGYAQLAEALSKDLDIRLNQAVQHVAYSNRGVTVKTAQQSYTADRAVITVPIGVLKTNQITFEPPLPVSKEKVIDAFGIAAAHKIVIRFSEVFWPRNRLYFGWISPTPNRFPLWVNVYAYTGAPVLALWSHGEAALRLEQLAPAEQLQLALESLQRVFGNKLATVNAFEVTRWQQDPFTLGAYSFLPVGTPEGMYTSLAQPIFNRVFFAGEATAPDSPATVHGAYNSGLTTARLLLSSRT